MLPQGYYTAEALVNQATANLVASSGGTLTLPTYSGGATDFAYLKQYVLSACEQLYGLSASQAASIFAAPTVESTSLLRDFVNRALYENASNVNIVSVYTNQVPGVSPVTQNFTQDIAGPLRYHAYGFCDVAAFQLFNIYEAFGYGANYIGCVDQQFDSNIANGTDNGHATVEVYCTDLGQYIVQDPTCNFALSDKNDNLLSWLQARETQYVVGDPLVYDSFPMWDFFDQTGTSATVDPANQTSPEEFPKVDLVWISDTSNPNVWESPANALFHNFATARTQVPGGSFASAQAADAAILSYASQGLSWTDIGAKLLAAGMYVSGFETISPSGSTVVGQWLTVGVGASSYVSIDLLSNTILNGSRDQLVAEATQTPGDGDFGGVDELNPGVNLTSVLDPIVYYTWYGALLADWAAAALSPFVAYASVNYTLSTGLTNLSLQGSANITGTGNSAANVISSNSGVDILNGGGGDDVFIVSNSADIVNQVPGTNSKIYSSVNYALPANINTLILTGSANLTGRAFLNSTGDYIYSNSGVDTLYGGGGNDTFIVNNSNDIIVEQAGARAVVYASVNYRLAQNVNTLALTGTKSLTGFGNGANNVIYANSGGDTLVDGGGAVTFVGGAGNDVYSVSNSSDTIVSQAGAGNDVVYASVNFVLPANVNELVLTGSGNLTGTGNSATNWLYSNSGIDTLIGQGGNDVFVVNNSQDVIIQISGTNSMVYSSASYTLPANVNQLVLTGSSNLTGTGNAAANYIYSNSGIDTLIGGGGNDVFIVNNIQDMVQQSAGTNSIIYSSVSFNLPTNVDNLYLTGSGNVSATGNSNNNQIRANSGNDVIQGGLGNDTIFAGSGSDTLTGGGGNDTFAFSSPGGFARIMDFQVGADVLALSTSSFALSVLHDGTNFIAGSNPVPNGSSSTILYNTATGNLSLAPQGAGGIVDTFAQLATIPTLHASSFTFI